MGECDIKEDLTSIISTATSDCVVGVNEWIKVENDLPLPNNPVLATDGKSQFVAERYIIERYGKFIEYFEPSTYECCNFEENKKITHWMPLPELPK